MLDGRPVTFDEMCQRNAGMGMTQNDLRNMWRDLRPDPKQMDQMNLDRAGGRDFRSEMERGGLYGGMSLDPRMRGPGQQRGYDEYGKPLSPTLGQFPIHMDTLLGPAGAENRALHSSIGGASAFDGMTGRIGVDNKSQAVPPKRGPGQMQIVVKKVNTLVDSPSGQTTIGLGNTIFSYTVHPRDCIYDLKTRIYYDVGWAPRHQRLVFNRTELQDEHTLEDLGLQNQDTVSLIRLQPWEVNPILTGKSYDQTGELCEPKSGCVVV